MKRLLAALLLVTAASAAGPVQAQDPADKSAVDTITSAEITPEALALGMQLVKLSGSGRTFDELLPNIADQAKNAFVRANPQMQLGIIEVVDRVARGMVSRRPELDNYLARAWASGFSQEEMEELVEFYSSDTGKKFAEIHYKLLAVQMSAAQEWGREVSRELTQKVSTELRSTMQAEGAQLQGGAAPAVGEPPAEAPAQ